MAVTAQASPVGSARKPQPRHGGVIGAGLLALLALCFVLLLHTRHEPLENNMPQYALMGHEILGGRLLYTDIFDQKPPAIYGTYMLAEMAFGYNRDTIFYLELIGVGITLLGVYKAGASLFEDRRWGLWGAAGYALACGDIAIEANQPNAEVFISACLVWGFALLIGGKPKVATFLPASAAGLLFALATLYKPNVVVVPLLLMTVYVAFPPGGAGNRRTALRMALWIVSLIALAWAGVCLYFAAHGRFADFYYAVVTYNQAYAGSLTKNLLTGLHRSRWDARFFRLFTLCGLATFPLGLLSWKSPARSAWLLLWAFTLGAYIAVILPGQYLSYYYVLLLPPLMVGLSWAGGTLAQARPPQTRYAALVLGIACVGLIAWRELKFQRQSVAELSVKKYSNDIFVRADAVAHTINTLLLPEEIFYDASTNPELYFTSKRPLQAGVFYSVATVKGPRAEAFADKIIASLERHPPELISLREGYYMTPPDDRNPRIYAWIRQRYVPLPSQYQIEPFVLLMRRDGVLSRRLPVAPTVSQTPPSAPTQKNTVKPKPTTRAGASKREKKKSM